MFWLISLADWKITWPQLGVNALACVGKEVSVVFLPCRLVERSTVGQTYLVHDVFDFKLHLLLRALEALPQLVAHRTPLQQRLQSRFGLSQLYNALNILDRAFQEGGFQH
jgi:hypothetical protein